VPRSELFKRVQQLYLRRKREASPQGRLSAAEPFDVHLLELGEGVGIYYLRPTNSHQVVAYIVRRGDARVRITDEGVQLRGDKTAAENLISQVLDAHEG
jgi:hypothetical protein